MGGRKSRRPSAGRVDRLGGAAQPPGHTEARNRKRLDERIAALWPTGRLPHRPGLRDRVIYRELFPFGLTVADLSATVRPVPVSLSHVAARQELRMLMAALGLGVDAAPMRARNSRALPMILVAIGVLGAGDACVGLGAGAIACVRRQPLVALLSGGRRRGRGAAWDAARGGWLGGSILLTAALWLATSSRAPEPRRRVRHGPQRGALDPGRGRERQPRRDRGGLPRLMLRAHPDQGGTAGLAAQLNAARDGLLSDGG